MIDRFLSGLNHELLWQSSLAWLAFGVCAVLAWQPWAGSERPGRAGAFVFGCSLLACLTAFRWPVLFIPYTLNIDESQMIAGALALRHDPVFWRAIEGQTIGPIDYYALVPSTLFTSTQLYAAARALGLLLVGSVVVLSYASARLIFSERTARWSAVALLAFFAFTAEFNFVHYSSEHGPICLLAIAITCLLAFDAGGRRRSIFFAGLALGAVPFAKLQAAPIAAWLFVCSAAYFWFARPLRPQRKKLLLAWFGGALSFPTLVAIYATVWGVWRDMKISYFDANLFYADTESASRVDAWRRIAAMIVHDHHFGPLLAVGLTLGAVALFLKRTGTGRDRWLLALSVGGLFAASAGVLIARRAYEHYLLLLTPSLGLVIAYALDSLAQLGAKAARPGRIAGWVVLIGGAICLPALDRAKQGNPSREYLSEANISAGSAAAVIAELQRWVKPGDVLAVWGWEPRLYVGTLSRQATRDPSTRREVEVSPDMDYYRTRYLADLQQTQPRVVIDTTGAHRQGFGFESFPAFRDYLQQHYRFVEEIEKRRIYLRNDIQE